MTNFKETRCSICGTVVRNPDTDFICEHLRKSLEDIGVSFRQMRRDFNDLMCDLESSLKAALKNTATKRAPVIGGPYDGESWRLKETLKDGNTVRRCGHLYHYQLMDNSGRLRPHFKYVRKDS